MCTFAAGGRITTDIVDDEISRLRIAWHHDGDGESPLESLLGKEALGRLDLFDRMQLDAVVGLSRRCRTLSGFGRLLFARSRERKTIPNDADRVRKYLGRFGLRWEQLRALEGSTEP